MLGQKRPYLKFVIFGNKKSQNFSTTGLIKYPYSNTNGKLVLLADNEQLSKYTTYKFTYSNKTKLDKFYMFFSALPITPNLSSFDSYGDMLTFMTKNNPTGLYMDLDTSLIYYFPIPGNTSFLHCGYDWRMSENKIESGFEFAIIFENNLMYFSNNGGEKFAAPNPFNTTYKYLNFVYLGNSEVQVTKTNFFIKDTQISLSKKPTLDYTNVAITKDISSYQYGINDFQGASTLTVFPSAGSDVYIQQLNVTGLPFTFYRTSKIVDTNNGWFSFVFTTKPFLNNEQSTKNLLISTYTTGKYYPSELIGTDVEFFYTGYSKTEATFFHGSGGINNPILSKYMPFEADITGTIRALNTSGTIKYNNTLPSYSNVFKTNPIYVYLVWYGVYLTNETLTSIPYNLFDNFSTTLPVNNACAFNGGVGNAESQGAQQAYKNMIYLITGANPTTWQSAAAPFTIGDVHNLTFTGASDKTTINPYFLDARRLRFTTTTLGTTTGNTLTTGASTSYVTGPFDIRNGFGNGYTQLSNGLPYIVVTTNVIIKDDVPGANITVKWTWEDRMYIKKVFIPGLTSTITSDSTNTTTRQRAPTIYYNPRPGYMDLIICRDVIRIPFEITTSLPLNQLNQISTCPNLNTSLYSFSSTGYSSDNTGRYYPPLDGAVTYDFTVPSKIKTYPKKDFIRFKSLKSCYFDPISYNKTPSSGNIFVKYLCSVSPEETFPVFKYKQNTINGLSSNIMIISSNSELFGLLPSTLSLEVNLQNLLDIIATRSDALYISMSPSSINTGTSIAVTYKGTTRHILTKTSHLTFVLTPTGMIYILNHGDLLQNDDIFDENTTLHVYMGTTTNTIEYNQSQSLNAIKNALVFPIVPDEILTGYLRGTGLPNNIEWATTKFNFDNPLSYGYGSINGCFASTNNWGGATEFYVRLNHVGASETDRQKLISNFLNTVTLGVSGTGNGSAGWPSPVANVWPTAQYTLTNGWTSIVAGGLNPRTTGAFLVNNGGTFVASTTVYNVAFTPTKPRKDTNSNDYICYGNTRINGITASNNTTFDFTRSDWETKVENCALNEDTDANGNKLGTTTFCPFAFMLLSNSITNPSRHYNITGMHTPLGEQIYLYNFKANSTEFIAPRLWYYCYSQGVQDTNATVDTAVTGKHFMLNTNYNVEVGVRVKNVTPNALGDPTTSHNFTYIQNCDGTAPTTVTPVSFGLLEVLQSTNLVGAGPNFPKVYYYNVNMINERPVNFRFSYNVNKGNMYVGFTDQLVTGALTWSALKNSQVIIREDGTVYCNGSASGSLYSESKDRTVGTSIGLQVVSGSTYFVNKKLDGSSSKQLGTALTFTTRIYMFFAVETGDVDMDLMVIKNSVTPTLVSSLSTLQQINSITSLTFFNPNLYVYSQNLKGTNNHEFRISTAYTQGEVYWGFADYNINLTSTNSVDTLIANSKILIKKNFGIIVNDEYNTFYYNGMVNRAALTGGSGIVLSSTDGITFTVTMKDYTTSGSKVFKTPIVVTSGYLYFYWAAVNGVFSVDLRKIV